MFVPGAARADYTTTINPATTWGTWQGWGCSLAWWAKVFGNQQNLANILFTTGGGTLNGQALPGLGLNIVRYNLGACSSATTGGSSMVLSPNITSSRQIQGFWVSPSTWDWSVDANQRQMLQYAKADGVNNFQLFSNSPMWWMCANDNPSGAANGANDNLPASNYDTFAVYLATVAQHFSQNFGIRFNSVEAFNEPSANWWTATGSQEGCHFNASTQAAVIGNLRTELNNRGLNNTMIAASDENNYTAAVSTWNTFSSGTQALVGCVQVHGYQSSATAATQLYNAVQGKQLWNSEYGGNDTSGMTMAAEINQDFTSLHNTAWCDWQPLDGSGWGLINANDNAGTIGSVNPKYYVLAQYTRSIRQGMMILSSGDPNTVAAYDPVNHDLVLVTANSGAAAETINYDLTSFYSAMGPVTGWCTTASGSQLYQQFGGPAISNGSLSLAFAGSSVQTLVIENVFLAAPSTLAWAVSAGSGAWFSPASWSPSSTPGAGTAVTFAGGGGTCVVNAAGATAASLGFSTSAAFALTSSGGAGLTVQSGITVSNSSDVTISAPLTLAAAGTWSIAPKATLSVSGAVSDSYALTETGGGMLVLEAVNPALTGPVTVSGGTLYTANTKNSGNEVLGNAQRITVNNGGAIVVDGALGTGYNALVGGGHSHPNIYINQGGLLASTAASPASNHLGQLVLDGGTVSAVGTNGPYGTWNLDGGVSTPGDIGSTSYILGGNLLLTQHTIVGGGSATVFSIVHGDTLVMNSTISSSVLNTSSPDSLVFTGGGTLILSGSNNYSTGTYVASGTLIVASPAALPTGSSVSVGANAPSIFGSLSAAPVEPVPEPSTVALFIVAAIVAAFADGKTKYDWKRMKTP
jgi:galactan endo-1,6-beta-galactosidase